jgi:ABC-type transporter Mla maintaining outer membrane lipid asymmetry permease subunit MlaE
MWDDAPRSKTASVVRRFLTSLSSAGWAARILVSSVAAFPSVAVRRTSRKELAHQLYTTGIRTLPVIAVVSLFIGMILALQVGLELRRFNQEVYLGSAVMISLIR